MTKRAEHALFACLTGLGTHETTSAKAFRLPLAEVEAAAEKLVADGTFVRVSTGVLFLSTLHFDRLTGAAPWPDGSFSDLFY